MKNATKILLVWTISTGLVMSGATAAFASGVREPTERQTAMRVAGVVEVRQGRGARVLPPPKGLPNDVIDAIEALVRGAASRGVVRQQLIRYLEETS